jgi:hypothetical protein
MNKTFAILFLFGAIGAFGLASRDSFKSGILFSKHGKPFGRERVVKVTFVDRIGYITIGIFSVVGFGYFVRQARNEDVPQTASLP